MRRALIIIGVVLILLGIAAVLHPTYTYHQQQQVAKVGRFQATVNEDKDCANSRCRNGCGASRRFGAGFDRSENESLILARLASASQIFLVLTLLLGPTTCRPALTTLLGRFSMVANVLRIRRKSSVSVARGV